MDDIHIEVFRKQLTKDLGSKGIKPPPPGSEKEQQLYQQWQRGKEKIQGGKNGST